MTTAIASFDVEEHFRIEAAVGLEIAPDARTEYARRMEVSTRGLLDQLAAASVKATFYIVGEIARSHPALVRAIRSRRIRHGMIASVAAAGFPVDDMAVSYWLRWMRQILDSRR